jgi:hypothetical protein
LTSALGLENHSLNRHFAEPLEVFIQCSPAGSDPLASGVNRDRDGGRHYDRSVEGWSRPASSGSGRVTKFLAKIVAWITAGYPDGVPGADRVPLFALLERRLSDEEVRIVAADLMGIGEFDDVDIGVSITEITDGLPTPEDIERVRARLAEHGWPLDDPRDEAEESE